MAKDIARLREEEARKEKERITGLRPAEIKKPAIPPPPPPPPEKKLEVPETKEEIPEKEAAAEPKTEEARELMELPEEAEKKEKEGLKEEKLHLEEELKTIEEKIRTIPEKKRPFELKKTELLEQKEELEKELEPILVREKEIEEKKFAAEEKERKATSLEKRKKLEKARWAIEDERRKIEKEKWAMQEKINGVAEEIKKIDSELGRVLEEENQLKEKKNDILGRLEKIRLTGIKIQLEKELKKAVEKRDLLEEEKKQLLAENEVLAEELSRITKKEKEIEEEMKAFEEEERMTKAPKEEQKIEKERWAIEDERRKTEKKRWEVEEKKKQLESQIKAVETNYQKALEKTRELEEKINRISVSLGPAVPPKETPEMMPKEPAAEEPVEEEPTEKEIFEEVEREKEKKLIEEIRKKAGVIPGAVPAPPPPPPPPETPSLEAKKPSFLEKFFIRTAVVVLIIIVGLSALFFYWYFKIRRTSFPPPAPPVQKETILSPEEILATLSLKERVGQLFIIGFEGEEITPEIKNIFQNFPPGGVILFSKNIKNEDQTKTLIENLQKLSQETQETTNLPLFVAVDQEGEPINRVQFLEEKTPQSEIDNKEEAFRVGLSRGKELKALGFNLNLAPVLDQLSPSDFLYPRSFQKDPKSSGELGKSIIEGQKEAGIFSAIKHFPGYAGISFNPEERLARLSQLPEISQFKKAVEANPEFVMVANIIVNELDSQKRFLFSEKDIEFLKEVLPGDYLIMTDDLSQNVFLQKFSLEDITTTPINAGVNVLLFSDFRENPEKAMEAFFQAVQAGKVDQEKIEQSVLKIIKIKQNIK
jgi:beta-glucosidase-like glycosyl hydrolase